MSRVGCPSTAVTMSPMSSALLRSAGPPGVMRSTMGGRSRPSRMKSPTPAGPANEQIERTQSHSATLMARALEHVARASRSSSSWTSIWSLSLESCCPTPSDTSPRRRHSSSVDARSLAFFSSSFCRFCAAAASALASARRILRLSAAPRCALASAVARSSSRHLSSRSTCSLSRISCIDLSADCMPATCASTALSRAVASRRCPSDRSASMAAAAALSAARRASSAHLASASRVRCLA
mmetsp:Transcript_48590/g.114044  ORF Transcript_48590/g.114044 Transcript_48590/m.114044 type:complete len:239 (-) Transcript_48590:2998-3714(-)